MKTYSLLFACCLSITINLFGQKNQKQDGISVIKDNGKTQSPSEKYAAYINKESLFTNLHFLSSEETEGRETGTIGQRIAADFIASKFETLGLPRIGEKNTYFQEIVYTTEGWNEIDFTVNGKKKKNLRDYYSHAKYNTKLSINDAEVVFLGYGIDDVKYSDYKNVNVKNKVAIIYPGEPKDDQNISHITGSLEVSKWSFDIETKLRAAKRYGVTCLLIIDPNIQKNIGENRRELIGGRMQLGRGEMSDIQYANSIYISLKIAEDILGVEYKKIVKLRKKITKKGKPYNTLLSARVGINQNKDVKQLIGSNVMGYIEGTDPKLKNELVIVTAHYDHLGKKGTSIFHGADDNGSGTSTVMQIAEGFSAAKREGVGPKRSVLCLLVSGEEKGLLGSKYYVENPVFPLNNTIANVNVDMIGRRAKEYDHSNYIYVIGADKLSTELHNINEKANAEYTHLILDYTYNDENDPNRYYYRSDHYNFAEKGIPAVFYFSGVHKDYHRPSDTIEKIEFEKMATIGKLIFHTTWELANRKDRIKVDVNRP